MSKVYLVGSGTGSLDYLTLRGKKLVETCDVLVYDSLIPKEILNLSNDSCVKVNVGKRKGKHSYSQDQINKLLLDLSKNHNRIVRLKGGDPFLFGRIGEEIEFLNKNNVNYEVIPGISSVQALQALLEIPLTHREFNHSVQILTGHNLDLINFNNLAKFEGNIVILMGVSNINQICSNLIKEGKSPLTPVALINDLNKRPVEYELGNLKSFSEQNKEFKSPGIIVIGGVLNHLSRFQQRKPRILITRPQRTNDTLSEEVENLGFIPVNVPLIRTKYNDKGIEKLEKELKRIQDYTYLVFTSPTSVEIFFRIFKKRNLDIRNLTKLKICCIGPGTERALNSYFLNSDLVPEEFSTDGIIKMIRPMLKESDKVLIPRSNLPEKKFEQNLKAFAKVNEIGIYDIQEENPDLNFIVENNGINIVTATSSSIAHNLSKLLSDENKKRIKVYSIGKETSRSLKGFTDIVESQNYSIDGLIETIKKDDITNTIKKK